MMVSIYRMKYYSVLKKNEILCASKLMELEDIMLSEASQVQKEIGVPQIITE
jgi:hypothetical protein